MASQGLNRYTYCANNPLIFTDPSGNEPITLAALAIAALIGAGIGAAIGGISSAAMGGNIGQGMLFGAITGAIGGSFGYIGFTLGGWVGSGIAGAGAGALGACITGGDPGMGAIIGGVAGLAFGLIQQYGPKLASGQNSDSSLEQAKELIKTNGTNETTGGITREMDPNALVLDPNSLVNPNAMTMDPNSLADPNSIAPTQSSTSGSVTQAKIYKSLGVYDSKTSGGILKASGKDFARAAKDSCAYTLDLNGTTNNAKAVKLIEQWIQNHPNVEITEIRFFNHGDPQLGTIAGNTLGRLNMIELDKILPTNCKIELVQCNVAKGAGGLNYIQNLANAGNRTVRAYDGYIDFNKSWRWESWGNKWEAIPGQKNPHVIK